MNFEGIQETVRSLKLDFPKPFSGTVASLFLISSVFGLSSIGVRLGPISRSEKLRVLCGALVVTESEELANKQSRKIGKIAGISEELNDTWKFCQALYTY